MTVLVNSPLPVRIVTGDARPGDTAVARAYERILAAQHPEVTWTVRKVAT